MTLQIFDLAAYAVAPNDDLFTIVETKTVIDAGYGGGLNGDTVGICAEPRVVQFEMRADAEYAAVRIAAPVVGLIRTPELVADPPPAQDDQKARISSGLSGNEAANSSDPAASISQVSGASSVDDNVLSFTEPKTGRSMGFRRRALRRKYKLSLSQASFATDLSPASIENWERSPAPSPTLDHLEDLFRNYVEAKDDQSDRNLLFGCYPLRFARQLLDITPEEMGQRLGYTKATWLKFESNARLLSDDKLELVQKAVQTKMASLCDPVA
jgi:transcriptional regulator with XRE-family HTH domain